MGGRRSPRHGWLLLRGLWWRRGLSASVFAVGAVVMGAAALGPLYARAAGESTLRDGLTQAGSATGLEFQDVPHALETTASVSRFGQAEAQAPPPGAVRGYPTRIASIYVQTKAQSGTGPTVQTGILWRDDACSHLIIVAGHCPTGRGQALVAQRTVNGNYSWQIGRTVAFDAGTAARIVGTYTPRDPHEPYWFGHDYFEAIPFPEDLNTVDAVFVGRAEFAAIPPSTQASLLWDYPLDPAVVRLDDVPRLRQDVAGLARRYSKPSACPYSCTDEPVHVQLTTGLDKVLDAAAHQRNLVDRGTFLVTLQLALLAWLALFEVVTDAIESRGNEIALAKLRGLRPWWTLRFALGEPLLLLAMAMPVGLGLAWGAARLFSSAVLTPNTPVVLTGYAALALVGGFAGGLVAAIAASYRTLTRSVLAQWRRTTRTMHASRIGLMIDLVLSAAAIAGLVLLRAGGAHGSNSAALLAPGLLVVAVALLGTRLLPGLARTLLRPTRASGRIGLFLAARQVARRPAGLRLAAILTVAVGLATFGVCGEAVAATNRGARAKSELGADRVVGMQYEQGVDPVAAVGKADPDGHWAMAAATWLPDGGNSVVGTVLAVDAGRMAQVGYPASGGPSAQQLADTIGSAKVAPVVTTASQLRVVISAADIRGTPPQVQFVLRSPGHPFLNVTAGNLQPGTHTYTARLSCAQGCTLLGLAWNRPVSFDTGTMSGRLTVQKVEQYQGSRWSEVDVSLTEPGAWRAGREVSESSDTLRAAPAGLRDDYRSSSGYGGITYASAPQPLPVVATAAGLTPDGLRPEPAQMIDGLGTVATFTVQQQTRVLPNVLDSGLIVNLTFLRGLLPDFDNEAIWTVWLGPHAPPDALARLRAAGLTLQQEHTTRSRVIELGRQAPALSLFVLLACAIIGSVVAVGGAAVAISASARRRSFETAALRVVGVPRRALYRGGLLEQLLLLGAAVVLGVPAGVLAARLAMPVIPEFGDTTPILLRYRPPELPVIAFAGGFLVLVCLTAIVATTAVLRAAVPTRLREAEE
jgi:putative ABC transport system permease protein